MIALAPPGSPQHGTLASAPEGPCQSLSWVVGRSFEFGPCDKHFPQLALVMKSWPLLNEAIPIHFGIWPKKHQSPGIHGISVLMSLLAPPGSQQNGALASELEGLGGPCQSLSWVVGGSSESEPFDEHFHQFAHVMKFWSRCRMQIQNIPIVS